MSNRMDQVPAELGKFLVVSGAATTVALTLFNFLVHGLGTELAPLADSPYLAYVIAHTVGMVVSYTGSRTWTFRHRPPSHPDGGWTAYAAINIACMAIPVACLWFSRSVLGLDGPVADNVSANLIGAVGGLAARYYLFRRFVFKRPIHLTEIYDDPEADESMSLPSGRLGE